jgi:pentatricopeptide repeat-containing protein PET309
VQKDIHYGVLVSLLLQMSVPLPYILFILDQNRAILTEEFAPTHDHPSRRYASHHISRPKNTRSTNPLTPGVYSGQRRHVSGAPDIAERGDPPSHDFTSPVASPSTITLDPDSNAVAVQRFQLMLQCAIEKFDIEAAWDAYNSVVDCGAVSSLSVGTLLSFSAKLTEAVELLYRRDTNLETLHEWGGRIQGVLESFKSHIAVASMFDLQWHCLLARSTALNGDLERARSLLRTADNIPSVYEDKGVILRGFQTIMLSTWRHHTSVHVLELIMDEWSLVGSHLTGMSSRYHHASPAVMGRSLRQTALAILVEIEHSAAVLASKTNWTNERRQSMGNFLIEVLCDQRLPMDALEVLNEMNRQSLSAPINIQLVLVRELVREDFFEQANALYSSIEGNESMFKYHMSTGLYLHAHQGNTIQAEKYYNDLVDHNWATTNDIAMLLYSYATLGRTEQVAALFTNLFPEGPDGTRLNSPTLLHYSIVIYAHAQKADFDGLNVWLQAMSNAGFSPDLYVFTNILKSLALRGDMESIVGVLNQMRTTGIQPNYVTYTTVITLLARRRDPAGAEVVYKRAIEEGVVPDRRMITALMNAHVAAGSWKGVIRVFDYIKSSPKIRLTLEVYNTLLKAYVFIGAPFSVVSRLFARLEDSRVKPDAYTFSLLIQSACDAGHMRIASDIYHEMQGRSSDLLVNVYALTIMMAGYLRMGDRVKAKAVYDEMRDKGVQPSSVTFRKILTAYGSEQTEESMQIAEQFVRSLMSGPAEDRVWASPPHGRTSAIGHIYGPLLNAYAKLRQPEQVERLLGEMLEEDEKPTLGILTMLLDAYRRTFNIDAVQQLWPQIFQLGLQASSEGLIFQDNVKDATRRRLQGNILCIPLSIYIDALSAAGLHLDIADIWKSFQDLGFTFDSHNWNHLTVALVRAGEPERAFEIIEKVILPYQRASEHMRKDRDRAPTTPLSSDTLPSDEASDDDEEMPLEVPAHGTRRSVSLRTATTRLAQIEFALEDEEHVDDFAHPLHILHQISPSWATWKPHRATLSVLLLVLSRLESGALIEPVTPANVLDDAPPVDIEKALKAREMLNRIYKNHPNAVQAVLAFEAQERRMLADDYDRMYKWR